MTHRPLHERLQFDTVNGQVLDMDRRYVLMRADVLMGVFEMMQPERRAEALEAFARSVLTYGSNSVRAYDQLGDGGAMGLFNAVAEGAASLGWGVWTFKLDGHMCRLEVLNSPFAHAGARIGTSACAPILGMLRAVCTHVWARPCVASELVCAGCSGPAGGLEGICRFEARVSEQTRVGS